MKSAARIKSILIDPFQMELYPVSVRPDSAQDVAKLLDCEMIQAIRLSGYVNGTEHVVWIDESGLLREPFVYPCFALPNANNGQPMAGYGLITGISDQGQMLNCQFGFNALIKVLGYEPWRARISIDNVIPQMLRVYTLDR